MSIGPLHLICQADSRGQCETRAERTREATNKRIGRSFVIRRFMVFYFTILDTILYIEAILFFSILRFSKTITEKTLRAKENKNSILQ